MNYFDSEIIRELEQIKEIKLCDNKRTKKEKALFIYGEIKFNLGMLFSPHNDNITDYNKTRLHIHFYEMLEDLKEIIMN